MWHEEQKNDEPGETHQQTGDDEAEAPVCLDELGGYESAEYVADRRVRVPHTEYQTALPFAEPIADHRHDTRPSGRLKNSTESLRRTHNNFHTEQFFGERLGFFCLLNSQSSILLTCTAMK